MIDFGKGIISGVIATALLCGVLYSLSLVGALTRPDPVYALSGIRLWPPALSWIAQFALGAFVWGVSFAPLGSILPGPYWLKGVAFGVLTWLLALGAAWLEPTAVPPVGVVPIALHVLFGGALGITYGAIVE